MRKGMFKIIPGLLVVCLGLSACSGQLTQQQVKLTGGETYNSNQFRMAGTFGSDEWCTAQNINHQNQEVLFYPGCHASTGEVAGAIGAVVGTATGTGAVLTGIGLLKTGNAAGSGNGGSSGGNANVTVNSSATATNK